jgi:hypothetical protein
MARLCPAKKSLTPIAITPLFSIFMNAPTPETDEFEDGCINPAAWADFARKLEQQRDGYKAAYDVAIYNLIGVAGVGHPGVSEATLIVDSLENH